MMLLPVKHAPGYFYNPVTNTMMSNKSGELRPIKYTKWRFRPGSLFEGWRLSVKGRTKYIHQERLHYHVADPSTCFMQVFEEYHEYRALCNRSVSRPHGRR